MTDRAPLVLLHTAQSNIDAFGALLAETAPDVPVRHVLNEALLNDAIAAGRLTDEVRARTTAALLREAEAGAQIVLCTCSTVGPGAEDAAARSAVPVLRVDRPMALEAVRAGGRIGVAATLATTLEPTMDLIRGVAAEEGVPVTLEPLLFEAARAAFVAKDMPGYLRIVAEGLREAAGRCDRILLAQASMAPALEQAGELPVPVLSSPRSGLAAAVAAWRAAG